MPKDVEQRPTREAPRYQIYVPSDGTYIVQYSFYEDGGFYTKEAVNSRELEAEAGAVVEPLIRVRWIAHWQRVEMIARQAQQAKELREVMALVISPEMYYPCPDWLAAKAVVKREG